MQDSKDSLKEASELYKQVIINKSLREKIKDALEHSDYQEITKLIRTSNTLTQLDLSSLHFNKKFAGAVADGLSNHQTFLKISFNASSFDKGALKILLSGFKNNNVIAELEIKNGYLKDNVANEIAEVIAHKYSSLTSINLDGNGITDKGAQRLANALISNKQLFYLILDHNNITDEGANALLTSLTKNPSTALQKLELDPHKISSRIIGQIEKLLEEAHYTSLDFLGEATRKDEEEKKEQIPVPKTFERDSFNLIIGNETFCLEEETPPSQQSTSHATPALIAASPVASPLSGQDPKVVGR